MTVASFPVLNLLGKKGRTGALVLFALFLSFSLFGGALLLVSLRGGLRSLELRLGADLIVVPYEARTKVSADVILNQGNRTYFYMGKNTLSKVAQVAGVERASPQVYLCSMNAGCCSVSLQLIGFDPATDFTIQPWVRQRFGGTLGAGDILIGSNVSLSSSRKLKFFGKLWNIAAQLAETGTGLDNAVFANLETIQMMLDAAAELDFTFADKAYSDGVISTVMVKVADGADIDKVARQIRREARKTQTVKAKSMTSGIADSLAGTAKIIGVFAAVVWVLSLIMLVVVSTLIIGERKKEFAVLRVMGASRKTLSRLVMTESLLVNLAGGVCGIVLASLCILPFHTLISQNMGLPFLLPQPMGIIALALGALVLSVLCGSLTSAWAAHQIARVDTGIIVREGN